MLPSLRVLLVEDDFLIALSYEVMLQSEGHQMVGLADHARTAIALAREHRPDLALVDINLTDGATGPEIAEYLIQALNVPVLFISANPEGLGDDLRGAIGLLSKPVSEQSFISAMRYIATRLKSKDTPLTVPTGLTVPSKRLLRRGEDDPSAA